jgi:hypothetical protein
MNLVDARKFIPHHLCGLLPLLLPPEHHTTFKALLAPHSGSRAQPGQISFCARNFAR